MRLSRRTFCSGAAGAVLSELFLSKAWGIRKSAGSFWAYTKKPDGPYVNRDGQSNPENFNKHREVMISLSVRMPALTAGWLLTGNALFAKRAGDYLRAWFVTPATRMNPNLEFSQGVHGVSTGRSYGIIDTLHLVEVARAASFLNSAALSDE